MVLSGALTVRPGGGESERDPSMFWAQLLHLGIPASFSFMWGNVNPRPLSGLSGRQAASMRHDLYSLPKASVHTP